ncbi:hypothetical protein AVEN_128041-1 [Araneus ventricosus]|uniref:Uncharacterized protein n=1 Tax=Araneus ventricosus TaxID=182803 RepID=A0A4Y1ZZA8_ARAVE|nr:hypothetical protein AVEN_128041-1 [Araneus ventricosus]
MTIRGRAMIKSEWSLIMIALFFPFRKWPIGSKEMRITDTAFALPRKGEWEIIFHKMKESSRLIPGGCWRVSGMTPLSKEFFNSSRLYDVFHADSKFI